MSRNFTRKSAGRDFISNEGGNAFMIFGLAFVPVMFMMGAATDYTRLTTLRAELQQGTDLATLAVASKMTDTTTNQQAQSQAQVLLNANPKLANATITNVSISADKQTFCASSQASMSSFFMKMARIANLNATVNSCANLAGGVDPNTTYEIALVLDNSGSMTNSTNGQTKLAALKTAANSFVDTMFSKAPNKISFSVVPFAGGVVAVDPTVSANRTQSWIDTQGQNSQHWIAFGGKTAATAAGFTNRFDIFAKLKVRNSQLDWRGCFEEPAYPYNVNADSLSTSSAETLMVPYLAPDEPDGSSYFQNSYMNDDGKKKSSSTTSTCSDSASGDWSALTHVCKYNQTASLSGSFGPSDFYGSNQFCPDNSTQAILQLNAAQSTIKSKISQLVANGNTALHTGFMWGWRTLTPSLPFSAGRAYGTQGNRKIMVFMTDGFNNWGAQTNTEVGSDYEALGYYTYNGAANKRLPDGTSGVGDATNYQTALTAAANTRTSYLSTSRKALDQLTLEACNNAKAAGVEVFTIGFSIPTDPIDQQGLNLLQACATNTDHYFAATNASQLNAAFSQIGIGLGKLRLSQ
ncbi:pilus assembly protein TadG-related protein [Methylocystis sp. JAN1]|uniref:pilus assembly protein TadG-related protein n=1 Tax=Methylocystis sp. JAN1 TaxID=3397211 RepID=UPI003FA1CF74